jgi:hypothetical protein
MIRLGHRADPYNVVVYTGYSVIVIGFRVGSFRGQRYDCR